MKTLEIEMIHDLVCSWCHIGYHNISRALEALLQAYHVEGRDISDLGVLVKVAKQVGLEEAVVIQSMTSDVINRHLQALSERVSHYNVRSVPAFVFNGSHFVSGSHTADFFARLIRSEFLSEENTQSEEKAQCPM